MKKIPIAKISNKTETINVFFPDYWEDMVEGKKPPAPYKNYKDIPDYDAEGSIELKEDFLHFALMNEQNGYTPYPWANASDLAERFAKENNLQYEDTFPQELQDEVDKAYNPNTQY